MGIETYINVTKFPYESPPRLKGGSKKGAIWIFVNLHGSPSHCPLYENKNKADTLFDIKTHHGFFGTAKTTLADVISPFFLGPIVQLSVS